MVYFIGNVLSPTATQPEQEDATFAFSREEAQQLDLYNTPIRMEHHPDMEVGVVRSSWTGKDGSKWVVGKLNDDGLQSIFAKHAIGPNKYGTPYYTGLSLQHTHTQYASGKTSKEAVEVSLCCDPRRADCRITFVSVDPTLKCGTQSGKSPYKAWHRASQMSAPIPTPTTSTPAAPTAPAATPTNSDANSGASDAGSDASHAAQPSKENMMEVIVKQQELLEAAQRDQLKYVELQKSVKQQEELEINDARLKNEVFAKALVETWSKELSQDDLTDESRHNIMALASKYPKETQDFFRIAHHASKKMKERDAKMLQEIEASKNTELKASFNSVMSKQVHAANSASKPAAQAQTPHDTSRVFMETFNKYRDASTGRDLMTKVLETQQHKRRKMYE
jgi:hypothetical protein